MPAMLPACDALPALVTACALLLPSVPPAPAPQRQAAGSGPLPFVHSATAPEPEPPEVPLPSPMYQCPGRTFFPKNHSTRFVPRGDPGGRPPRPFFPKKIFKPKIRPGWRAALGLSRGGVGAAGDGSAGPLAA